MDNMKTKDATAGAMTMRSGEHEDATVHGRYTAECYGADGTLKWREDYDNLVTDLGARLMLDGILGNTASGAIRMGLKGTGSAAAADTQASHSGWLEVGGTNAPAYSGDRKTPSFSAAAGSTGSGNRSKATSAAVSFEFTSGGTVAGSFLNIGGSATKDNTTGTLFSAGDFGSSRTVENGDTLNVTYTLSA
jgi:hypothetical protein